MRGAVGLALVLGATLMAQSVAVNTSGGSIKVQSALGLIQGAVLDRLRDGRSVQVEMQLLVLRRPGEPAAASASQTCNISFDLWEERFAVTRVGPPARSVSHLRGPEAERWCLDQLAIPRADLGTWPSDAPFWVRLRYVVAGDEDVSHSEADVFTIRRLIDVFSRRSAPSDAGRTIDAGPFPLPD